MIRFAYIVLSAIKSTSLSEDTYATVESKNPQILRVAFVRLAYVAPVPVPSTSSTLHEPTILSLNFESSTQAFLSSLLASPHSYIPHTKVYAGSLTPLCCLRLQVQTTRCSTWLRDVSTSFLIVLPLAVAFGLPSFSQQVPVLSTSSTLHKAYLHFLNPRSLCT